MPPSVSPWRLSVAPMMDWTDRHCRYFHRLLTKQTLLYTEMVTTGALMHGSVQRHLRFNSEEHPVALQLGGVGHFFPSAPTSDSASPIAIKTRPVFIAKNRAAV